MGSQRLSSLAFEAAARFWRLTTQQCLACQHNEQNKIPFIDILGAFSSISSFQSSFCNLTNPIFQCTCHPPEAIEQHLTAQLSTPRHVVNPHMTKLRTVAMCCAILGRKFSWNLSGYMAASSLLVRSFTLKNWA